MVQANQPISYDMLSSLFIAWQGYDLHSRLVTKRSKRSSGLAMSFQFMVCCISIHAFIKPTTGSHLIYRLVHITGYYLLYLFCSAIKSRMTTWRWEGPQLFKHFPWSEELFFSFGIPIQCTLWGRVKAWIAPTLCFKWCQSIEFGPFREIQNCDYWFICLESSTWIVSGHNEKCIS